MSLHSASNPWPRTSRVVAPSASARTSACTLLVGNGCITVSSNAIHLKTVCTYHDSEEAIAFLQRLNLPQDAIEAVRAAHPHRFVLHFQGVELPPAQIACLDLAGDPTLFDWKSDVPNNGQCAQEQKSAAAPVED
jgi:hypothetical protein